MFCPLLVITLLLATLRGLHAGTLADSDANVGLEKSKYSVIEGQSLQVCVIVIEGLVANDTELTLTITDHPGKEK